MEWFENWFETSYYHTLYKNRDESEAQKFIERVVKQLDLKTGAKVLDLACGRGRHSQILAQLGFHVTGADLSKNSIQHAKTHISEEVEFIVHDMREPLKKSFDAVFNLFTSFGYFDHVSDNLKVLKSVRSELNPQGSFILDFLNSRHAIETMVPTEEKLIDGCHFHINRYVEDGIIVKKIRVIDPKNKVDTQYFEKVNAFSFDDLSKMLDMAGFKVVDVWGDYKLNKFEEKSASERCIFYCQPKL
ncbi:class I SAM-dependent methyltransferase [Salibacter halophilus]|uniref:class I SAM-dependent methyltransferase n=1 Tax=Salibacter halophilus TaxID=1803916 RepID=UPI001CB8A86B|nr:class I SAM-dependent methyltransferase [Salibacter halophilus]